jgi:hypothetical protein
LQRAAQDLTRIMPEQSRAYNVVCLTVAVSSVMHMSNFGLAVVHFGYSVVQFGLAVFAVTARSVSPSAGFTTCQFD